MNTDAVNHARLQWQKVVLASIFFHLVLVIHYMLAPIKLNELYSFAYFMAIFVYSGNAMASRQKEEDVLKRGSFSFKPVLVLLLLYGCIFVSEQLSLLSAGDISSLGYFAYYLVHLILIIESAVRMCRIIDLLLRKNSVRNI